MQTNIALRESKSSLPAAIFITGLVAGTLDILAAYVVYGHIIGNTKLTSILKYISSAVFGRRAFTEGTQMVVYGLLFHYLIAFCFTILYFFIYPSIFFLRRHIIISGLLYGIVIWVVMNLLVLPVTKVQQGPFESKAVLIGMSILMVFVGLPISLLTHRYYRNTSINSVL